MNEISSQPGFNMQTLSGFAARVNDFNSLKRVRFPLVRPSLDVTQCKVCEDDLRLTPLTGPTGVTPVKGNRKKPSFQSQVWDTPVDTEVTASAVVDDNK